MMIIIIIITITRTISKSISHRKRARKRKETEQKNPMGPRGDEVSSVVFHTHQRNDIKRELQGSI